MKKIYLFLIIISVLLTGLSIRFIMGGDEDSWIKDSRGVYIKHGNPSETPDYVLEQQEAINCTMKKFENLSEEINSQCLGVCGDFAIDIVHVPRTEEDNKSENQCEDYNNKKVKHFIELDKEGNIVGLFDYFFLINNSFISLISSSARLFIL